MKKKILSIISLAIAFSTGLLIGTSTVFAKDLNITSNFDYSIEMFNTTYYISYDLDGGVLDKINTYTPEADDFELGIPMKEGWTFIGWTGSNGHIPNPKVIVKQGTVMNLTFKANWVKDKYGITIDGDGNYAPIYRNINGEEIVIGNPSKPGYEFNGWTGSNGSTPEKNILIPGNIKNPHFTPNWSLINYNISYSINDDNYVSATFNNPKTSYNVETNNFNLVNPTRTGYNFSGWTGSNGKIPQTTVTISKGSIDDRWYKANWNPIIYNINYSMDGGTNPSENPSTYTVEDSFTLANPSKTGFTFLGWSGTDISDKSLSVSVYRPSIGNRSYSANWQRNNYNVTYKLNDEVYDTKSIPYEGSVPEPDVDYDSRDEIFEGWNGIPSSMPAYDIEVTAIKRKAVCTPYIAAGYDDSWRAFVKNKWHSLGGCDSCTIINENGAWYVKGDEGTYQDAYYAIHAIWDAGSADWPSGQWSRYAEIRCEHRGWQKNNQTGVGDIPKWW